MIVDPFAYEFAKETVPVHQQLYAFDDKSRMTVIELADFCALDEVVE